MSWCNIGSRTRRSPSRVAKDSSRTKAAPSGVRGLQFYPSRDGSAVTCLWEAPSVESVQRYVDSTLGDSSENSCYEVATEKAFAERPSAISESAGRQVA